VVIADARQEFRDRCQAEFQILVLTYRDGIRHREAAHILGMSERKV
jgi:hypothetical protein